MMRFRRFSIAVLAVLYIILSSINALAVSDAEKTFLAMYFTDEELVMISATRSLKSIDHIAENVSVVTKDDMELMNAHTVADVLRTINGVQLVPGGSGVGSTNGALIQGSELWHVAVFLDGMLYNNPLYNTADIGTLPVQFIDRVELIKGPASSVWGSSLGGVINIITKPAGAKEGAKAMIRGSIGERNTGDYRAEVQGAKGSFGYYASLGRFQTDGFNPDDNASTNNLYARFAYRPSKDTALEFSLLYSDEKRGRGQFLDYDIDSKDWRKTVQGALSITSRLNSELDLDAAVRFSRYRSEYAEHFISSGEPASHEYADIKKYGAGAKLTWKPGAHVVVAGTDLLQDKSFDDQVAQEPIRSTRFALYVNDSISLGKLTVIPGLRYDDTTRMEAFISPSLGFTFALTPDILLRGIVARGFSEPAVFDLAGRSSWFQPNPSLKPEKVWSYQAGIETSILKKLWLKISAFDHEVRDIRAFEDVPGLDSVFTYVNKRRARRYGLEAEIKTVPIYNFTLSAGGSAIRAKDLDTDEKITGVPTATVNVGISYDDKKSLRGLLTANHIMYNMDGSSEGKYNSTVFDVNIIKKIYRRGELDLELFGTGHNIFDADQYWNAHYINARRWFEAGVRLRF